VDHLQQGDRETVRLHVSTSSPDVRGDIGAGADSGAGRAGAGGVAPTCRPTSSPVTNPSSMHNAASLIAFPALMANHMGFLRFPFRTDE
jgi:hypothetical protein